MRKLSDYKIFSPYKEILIYKIKKNADSKKGIPMIIGPNRVTRNIIKWIKKAIRNPKYARQRMDTYSMIS